MFFFFFVSWFLILVIFAIKNRAFQKTYCYVFWQGFRSPNHYLISPKNKLSCSILLSPKTMFYESFTALRWVFWCAVLWSDHSKISYIKPIRSRSEIPKISPPVLVPENRVSRCSTICSDWISWKYSCITSTPYYRGRTFTTGKTNIIEA